MTRRQVSARRRLADVYAKIPAMRCAGRCINSCTTFPVPRAERREIRRDTGTDIGLSVHNAEPLKPCPLLTDQGRCGAYDVRPLICRLWGATNSMTCPHGCRPERLLPVSETYVLMAEVYEISGQTSEAARFRRAAQHNEVERFAPVLAAAARGDITARNVEAIVAEMLHTGRKGTHEKHADRIHR